MSGALGPALEASVMDWIAGGALALLTIAAVSSWDRRKDRNNDDR